MHTHIIYPFISWWTFGLFSLFSYYKQGYEHLKAQYFARSHYSQGLGTTGSWRVGRLGRYPNRFRWGAGPQASWRWWLFWASSSLASCCLSVCLLLRPQAGDPLEQEQMSTAGPKSLELCLWENIFCTWPWAGTAGSRVGGFPQPGGGLCLTGLSFLPCCGILW